MFLSLSIEICLKNLRNALQIAKCEELIRTLYFYGLQKRWQERQILYIIHLVSAFH